LADTSFRPRARIKQEPIIPADADLAPSAIALTALLKNIILYRNCLGRSRG